MLLAVADAVRRGRAGESTSASITMRLALDRLELNPFVRAVVARWVAPCAAADGWGDPAAWYELALGIFTERRLSAPAEACRAGLRRLEPRLDGLAGREEEVLALVAEGPPNKTVVERLYLSPRTVEKHVERLLAETRSVNRGQLVAYALRRAS